MRAIAIVIALALSLLASACAFATAPPPPGTAMVETRVSNESTVPVDLTVKTPSGVLPGAVQPASLPARGTAQVTFYVPLGGDWWIAVNGVEFFDGATIRDFTRQRCMIRIEVNVDGSSSIGC